MTSIRRPPRFDPARPAVSRAALADWGERVAEYFLSRRGANVVARNLRVGRDELDLVVTWRRRIVVVEVKTRRGSDCDPAAAFDARKRSAVRRAASRLAAAQAGPNPVPRIDLVAIAAVESGAEIRWLKDVG